MIISSKYKFTFLKNPKTGGSAVHKEFDGLNTIEFSKAPEKPNRFFQSSFTNAYYGTQQFSLSPHYYNLDFFIDNNIIPGNIEEYTNYVVIREPVDRFMSFCRHVRKTGSMLHVFFKEQFNNISIEDSLLISKTGVLTPEILSRFSTQFKYYVQSISLQQIAEKAVQTPFDSKGRLDLIRIPQNYYYNDSRVTVIDYANLQQEIYALCERHNTKRTYTLPNINVGNRLDGDIFPESLINTIKEIYAEDVEFYNNLTTK